MKSRVEVSEERAAGRAAPFCPVCLHGNLIGSWEGPLGDYDRTAFIEGESIPVERGEWWWDCDNCGESGRWLPSTAHKSDPFVSGRAVVVERGEE